MFLRTFMATVYRFKQVVSNISRRSALRLGLFHIYGGFFQVPSKTYSFSQQQPYQLIELDWICRIFHFSFHVQCLYKQQELPLKAWPNIYIIRIILTDHCFYRLFSPKASRISQKILVASLSQDIISLSLLLSVSFDHFLPVCTVTLIGNSTFNRSYQRQAPQSKVKFPRP